MFMEVGVVAFQCLAVLGWIMVAAINAWGFVFLGLWLEGVGNPDTNFALMIVGFVLAGVFDIIGIFFLWRLRKINQYQQNKSKVAKLETEFSKAAKGEDPKIPQTGIERV